MYGGPFDEVIMESSPFLRSMQTMAGVCNAMGIESFEVNNVFGEHLESKITVGQNPVPLLKSKQESARANPDAFCAKYFDGIRVVDNGKWEEELISRYPESNASIKERVALFSDTWIQKYGHSKKRVLHVATSHGTLVKQFGRLHGGRKKKCKYTGVSVVAITTPDQTAANWEQKKPTTKLISNCKQNHRKLSAYCPVQ